MALNICSASSHLTGEGRLLGAESPSVVAESRGAEGPLANHGKTA